MFDPRELLNGRLGSVARNAALLTGMQLSQRLFGLITVYFVVRVLSKSAFGEYNFLLSIVSVMGLFGLPGMTNAVTQSVARGHRGTYRAALRPAILSSLAGGVVLVAIAGWYFHAGRNELAAGFAAAAVLFPASLGMMQWKGFKAGVEDFDGLVSREVITSIATSLLLLVSILYVSESFVPLVVILYAVPGAVNLWMTRSTLGQPGCHTPAETGIIRYGIVTSAFSILGVVASHIEKLIVFFFMTPESLAVFVAASRIPDLTKGLIKNIGTALAPRFARHSRYTRRVDRALGMFAVASGVVIVAIAFTVLPWFVLFVFGEDYRESIPYAQALMCSMALVNTMPLRSRFVMSRQDTASFRDFNATMAALRIAGSVILIPLLGLKGAVISVFASRIGSAIALHFIMKKRYPIDPDDV
jgi:O-antigen/teichoic acid export membrane protein